LNGALNMITQCVPHNFFFIVRTALIFFLFLYFDLVRDIRCNYFLNVYFIQTLFSTLIFLLLVHITFPFWLSLKVQLTIFHKIYLWLHVPHWLRYSFAPDTNLWLREVQCPTPSQQITSFTECVWLQNIRMNGQMEK
jgi:hypothetical protein